MAYYKRTRVVSQDQRTGEFAYLDQLINDGYNPGLLVLPKNWEPPLRQGPASLLPLEPIINLSPPNTIDTYPVILQNLVDITTGAAVMQLYSNSACGTVTSWNVDHNVTGIECVVSLAVGMDNISEPTPGQESTSAIGTSTDNVAQNLTGQSCTGTADANGIMVVTSGVTTISVDGQANSISLGTVLNGSGFSQGGGWGTNGWGAN